MGIGAVRELAGDWELAVDLPGAEDVRGHVRFELMGEVLVQRTTVPEPVVPDSCCLVVRGEDGGYVQHYFDSRGVVRIYRMELSGRRWTLLRTEADFSPLAFAQRFQGEFSADGSVIEGQWEMSRDGGVTWSTDFGMTYTRLS
jgi:hypothetical protein